MRLEEQRLKLKPVSISEGTSRILVRGQQGHGQLVLAAELRPTLEKLDGKRTLREVLAASYQERGRVSFRQIFVALNRLRREGLLEGAENFELPTAYSHPWYERDDSVFARTLFEKELVHSLHSPLRSPLLAGLCAALVALLGFWILCFHFNADLSAGFLRSGGSYVLGILFFFAGTSLLISVKALLRSFLVGLATGEVQGLSVQLGFYSLHLAADDAAIQMLPGRIYAALFDAASIYAYFAIIGVFAPLLSHVAWFNDLRFIALLLTMLALNPFRRSDMTRLFSRFYSESDMERFLPRLRRRRIDLPLLLFGATSVVWLFGCLLIFVELWVHDLPGLMQALSGPSGIEAFGAGLHLAALAFFGAHFAWDIVSAFAADVLVPLVNPLFRVAKGMRSKTHLPLDRDSVRASLLRAPFFRDLRESEIDILVDSGYLGQFGKGARILLQGTPNDSLYVLLRGKVGVYKRGGTGPAQRVALLGEGAVFGEVSVIRETLTTADVVAIEACECMVVDRASFLKIRSGGDEGIEGLLKRIMLGQVISTAEIFKDVPREVVQLFTSGGVYEQKPSGSIVTEQHAYEKSFYIIVRGRVGVWVDGKQIAHIEQGGFFGEISLIADVPRTATVKTLEDCLFLKIDSGPFWEALSNNLSLSMFIENVAETRLGQIQAERDKNKKSQ